METMDKQIIEKPKCVNYERCQNLAICLNGGLWVCGKCITELNKKIDNIKKEMLLHG